MLLLRELRHSNLKKEKKKSYEDEVEEDGDSIKTLNDLPPFPKTMEKSPLAPQLIKRK